MEHLPIIVGYAVVVPIAFWLGTVVEGSRWKVAAEDKYANHIESFKATYAVKKVK